MTGCGWCSLALVARGRSRGTQPARALPAACSVRWHSGLALEPEAIDDGVTMVSELAANTLHVQRRPAPANPELWLYLRGAGPRTELVGKVFDTLPGWVRGNVPGRTVARAPADAMSGRGLEVVHELSAGRWGHHLSRARLAGTALRGKAVWFALPAPRPTATPDGWQAGEIPPPPPRR